MASFLHSNRDANVGSVEAAGSPTKLFKYGTAGFRDDNTLLSPIMYRVGVLANARSFDVGCKCIGVMITASHNAEKDNGVKIVDADGGMLAEQWELIAEQVINIKAASEFNAEIEKLLCNSLSQRGSDSNATDRFNGNVILGRDTRPHSLALMQLAKAGVELLGGTAHDIGIVTTPQLHYAVHRYNSGAVTSIPGLLPDYYATLLRGYQDLIATANIAADCERTQNIIVDCAKGVGSLSVCEFQARIAAHNASSDASIRRIPLRIDVRNAAYCGPVNEGCGAEHCQKLQIPPLELVAAAGDASGGSVDGKMVCSLDGDADRIVFHMQQAPVGDGKSGSGNASWVLYDGDKIACLVAQFLKEELVAAGLTDLDASTSTKNSGGEKYAFGVVQTAYANGASTRFLRSRGVPVLFAKTGVKHLHRAAHHAFDCGVYFEANGHGTVLFSRELQRAIETACIRSDPTGVVEERKNLAFVRLKACLAVVNQVTGDAVSDMLFALAIQKVMGIDDDAWSSIYSDLPSRQVKVSVRDKSLITCSDDEMAVVTPAALQEVLDACMKRSAAEGGQGRCFVRPSGTEDVVRIYAEGTTAEHVAWLIEEADKAIRSILG